MKLSRRQLLAALPAGLLVPRALAGGEGRRFLFVVANGGWDPTHVFAPAFDNPRVDMPRDSAPVEIGGIPLVDSPSRPSVRRFFERNASRACVVNGIEVPSVAHPSCMRLLMTGSPTGGDDWASVLAHHAEGALLLPHIVSSGPAYTASYPQGVVRIGSASQLPELLDGSALQASDQPARVPAGEELVDAYVATRSAADPLLGRDYSRALQDLAGLRALERPLSFGAGEVFADQVNSVLDCFSQGLSRCAMLADQGIWDLTWDSHAALELQELHFEQLFGRLVDLSDALESRGLRDSTTVVVLSEMGRHPQLNDQRGKHHWTTTSALLFGAGIAGRRVVGAYTDDMGGSLHAADLGATLLALGDVDPGPYSAGSVIADVLA